MKRIPLATLLLLESCFSMELIDAPEPTVPIITTHYGAIALNSMDQKIEYIETIIKKTEILCDPLSIILSHENKGLDNTVFDDTVNKFNLSFNDLFDYVYTHKEIYDTDSEISQIFYFLKTLSYQHICNKAEDKNILPIVRIIMDNIIIVLARLRITKDEMVKLNELLAEFPLSPLSPLPNPESPVTDSPVLEEIHILDDFKTLSISPPSLQEQLSHFTPTESVKTAIELPKKQNVILTRKEKIQARYEVQLNELKNNEYKTQIQLDHLPLFYREVLELQGYLLSLQSEEKKSERKEKIRAELLEERDGDSDRTEVDEKKINEIYLEDVNARFNFLKNSIYANAIEIHECYVENSLDEVLLKELDGFQVHTIGSDTFFVPIILGILERILNNQVVIMDILEENIKAAGVNILYLEGQLCIALNEDVSPKNWCSKSPGWMEDDSTKNWRDGNLGKVNRPLKSKYEAPYSIKTTKIPHSNQDFNGLYTGMSMGSLTGFSYPPIPQIKRIHAFTEEEKQKIRDSFKSPEFYHPEDSDSDGEGN